MNFPFVFIAATAAFVIFSACGKERETVKPVRGSVTESVYASGTIKSKGQYEVYAQATGIIKEILVSEGDTVKEGQALLYISNDIQRLNKENAELAARYNDLSANESKLQEAESFKELARQKLRSDSLLYARQQALWKDKIGSLAELEQRELVFQNSRTAYQSAMIKADELRRQLEFSSSQARKNLQIMGTSEKEYTVRSEMDGIVYSLEKLKGEIVNMQSPLAVIGDAKEFILEMQVDEYDIIKVKQGQLVLVTMDAYGRQVFEARVTRIFPLMNERSKSFKVEARFTEPPPVVYPNTSFEAGIVISRKENALVIPRTFMLNDSTVVNKESKNLKVRTGLRDFQVIEIVEGVGVDEELIKPL